MEKTLDPLLSSLLLISLFCCGQAQDAVLTTEPNRSTFYSGEFVTFRCDMNEGENSDWEYKLNRNNGTYLSIKKDKNNTFTFLLLSGEYQCCGCGRSSAQTKCSNSVTVSADKPRATLTAMETVIPAGGNVTLTCSVDGSTGWKFDWFRNGQQYYPAVGSSGNTEPNGTIRVSEGGEYSCRGGRGGRGDPVFYSETSNKATIWRTDPNKPSLVLQPNWSQIYRGEKVTLRCEIQGGTQWTYEWRPTNRNSPSSSEYRINSATDADSGEYSCRGNRDYKLTEWSDSVRLTVKSSPPQPVLSVSPSWLNPGAPVTLSCEGLEHQPAGWRFYWYKAVPDSSKWSHFLLYSYKLLPGNTNGTEQNSFIINGSTHTAGFVCRAGRGEPKIYTYYSEVKFIWSADPGPAASLSVNPDRVQHFRSESMSLSCEGNSTEWRVKRFTERGELADCSYGGRMNGCTCTIEPFYFISGVVWCESKSGEFSKAVNITVQNDYYDGIILLSPVHPVTEGDPVTLRCRNKDQLLSNVFFYHNDKLIHNDSREQLNISVVSKSDEGFYKCQHSGKDSSRSWMSVRVTSPASSLFLMLLIIGPVARIVLIFLLLLFFCCRRNNADGPSDVTYSQNELRGFRENYSTPMYVNINYQTKNKRKQSPAATDADAVYSEITTGAALGNNYIM